MFAYLYAPGGGGKITLGMGLLGLANAMGRLISPVWNDSGTGTLYPEGESVLVAGPLAWKLL